MINGGFFCLSKMAKNRNPKYSPFVSQFYHTEDYIHDVSGDVITVHMVSTKDIDCKKYKYYVEVRSRDISYINKTTKQSYMYIPSRTSNGCVKVTYNNIRVYKGNTPQEIYSAMRQSDKTYSQTIASYKSSAKFYVDGIHCNFFEFREATMPLLEVRESLVKYLGIDDMLVNMLGIEAEDDHLVIKNPPNEEKFFKILDEDDIKTRTLITAYHGTPIKNINSILRSGLCESKRGSLGPGVYLGPHNKALCFASGWKSNDKKHRVLFEVDAIYDNVIKDTMMPIDKYREMSYLDCYYRGFKQPEWVIRDAKRILLKKIHLVL